MQLVFANNENRTNKKDKYNRGEAKFSEQISKIDTELRPNIVQPLPQKLPKG